MTVSFRPRTGDYFLSELNKEELANCFSGKFPSPYWGLFFIKRNGGNYYEKDFTSFRPRTGDYFLSFLYLSEEQVPLSEFPSPYWGLFFIYDCDDPQISKAFDLSFRPRTGDYFLSYQTVSHERTLSCGRFPSPYWGLFFITKAEMILLSEDFLRFPSPYWGLFFICGNKHVKQMI